jgi:hypothetical protein
VWIFRYRRERWNLRQPWLEGYKYNDISYRSFKYCHVRAQERTQRTAEWNPVRLGPSILAASAFALLVGATLFVARRQVKGW